MEWKAERETYLRFAKMRRERARVMRQSGMTFAEIGKEFGVTRQRIQQMLAKKD